jgi:Sec-independent protein translocase protein TatA
MDFLSVGSAEILMVLLVALLVVGPNKVVGYAQKFGQIMRSVRKASSELTSAVTREMELEDREKSPPPAAPARPAIPPSPPRPTNPEKKD